MTDIIHLPSNTTRAKRDDPISEGSIAEAFAAAHREEFRFDHQTCQWLIWTGAKWAPQTTKLAYRWAHETAVQMAATAGDKKGKVTAGRASFAGGVERLAQAHPDLAVESSQWNPDPWLLGTPKGTVNLRTGELRPANREDFITNATAVAPAEPETPHPIWSQFLDQATDGDSDLQEFMQRLAGYLLTGDVSEEQLTFLYGEGGTGKGTFIGTLAAVLGDYAVSMPIEVFTASAYIKPEYYRAQMAHARLVTASETEAGAMWAESHIKELTGNEGKLSARHPGGKPFSFTPQFKIVIVGNHAPRLKGRSKAMERRLRIIPFKHAPDAPDLKLKEKLRAEYPAILRWMINGCIMWQRIDLGTCQTVQAETDDYFEQQDTFGRWLTERCILDGNRSEKPSVLLADYAAWAKKNSEPSMTAGEFKELLGRTKGIHYRVHHGNRSWCGVGLQPPDGTLCSNPSQG